MGELERVGNQSGNNRGEHVCMAIMKCDNVRKAVSGAVII